MFLKNVSKLVGSTFFAQLAPLIVLPILTRNMEQDYFGVYSLFFTSLIMVGTLAAFRYDYALNSVTEKKEVNALLLICFVLSFCTSLVISLFIIALVLLEYLSIIWFLFPITVFLFSVQQTFYQYANSKAMFSLMASSKIIGAFSTAIFQFILVYIMNAESGAFWGLGFGYVLSIIVFMLYVPLKEAWHSINKIKFIMSKYKSFPMLVYPGTLLNFISGNLPLYVIGLVYGANLAGQYSLANRAAGIPTSMLARSFGEVYRTKALQDLNKLGSFRALFSKVTALFLLMGLVGFSVLFFWAESLYLIIFGEGWEKASWFTQLLIPVFLMQFITAPVSYSLMIVGWQKKEFLWQIFRLFLMGLAVVVSFFFSVPIGIFVIAVSFVMTFSFLVYFFLCLSSAFHKDLL